MSGHHKGQGGVELWINLEQPIAHDAKGNPLFLAAHHLQVVLRDPQIYWMGGFSLCSTQWSTTWWARSMVGHDIKAAHRICWWRALFLDDWCKCWTRPCWRQSFARACGPRRTPFTSGIASSSTICACHRRWPFTVVAATLGLCPMGVIPFALVMWRCLLRGKPIAPGHKSLRPSILLRQEKITKWLDLSWLGGNDTTTIYHPITNKDCIAAEWFLPGEQQRIRESLQDLPIPAWSTDVEKQEQALRAQLRERLALHSGPPLSGPKTYGKRLLKWQKKLKFVKGRIKQETLWLVAQAWKTHRGPSKAIENSNYCTTLRCDSLLIMVQFRACRRNVRQQFQQAKYIKRWRNDLNKSMSTLLPPVSSAQRAHFLDPPTPKRRRTWPCPCWRLTMEAFVRRLKRRCNNGSNSLQTWKVVHANRPSGSERIGLQPWALTTSHSLQSQRPPCPRLSTLSLRTARLPAGKPLALTAFRASSAMLPQLLVPEPLLLPSGSWSYLATKHFATKVDYFSKLTRVKDQLHGAAHIGRFWSLTTSASRFIVRCAALKPQFLRSSCKRNSLEVDGLCPSPTACIWWEHFNDKPDTMASPARSSCLTSRRPSIESFDLCAWKAKWLISPLPSWCTDCRCQRTPSKCFVASWKSPALCSRQAWDGCRGEAWSIRAAHSQTHF